MRLGDVDDNEVSYIAEVLDELLELLKFVHKRGSGATSKTQHQRSVPCRASTALTLGSDTERHNCTTTRKACFP